MSELSELDKFTPLQWHDCRIFWQLEFFSDGENWTGEKKYNVSVEKTNDCQVWVLLYYQTYLTVRPANETEGAIMFMACADVAIYIYNSAKNADETTNFDECINNASTCTVKLSRGHHDNDQESWWSNLSRQHPRLVFIQWGFLATAHRCYNPGFQVLQICLIHLMLVGHRPVFCLPYVSLATQQFQAWTPNGSKHDSMTDLRFRCRLPLGVSSGSSKYINFLSDCVNFHEPRSGNDANIRSFGFSNSSLKQISSNSVYIFLRISPRLWEIIDSGTDESNTWPVCVLPWQLVHCGSLHRFD